MGRPSDRKNRLILTVAVPVALAIGGAAAVFAGVFGSGGGAPIDHVFPVDEDTLLVAGNTGRDIDVNRSGQLALLELDGTLHTVVRSDEAVDVIGVADDIVWLRDRTRGIHARTLPDLGLIEGIGEAVKSHGPLSHRAEPDGFTATHVRLLAGDGKRYVVDRNGTITADDEKTEWTPRGGREAKGERAVSFEEVRALMTKAEEAGLAKPGLVTDPLEPGAVVIDEPKSVLVKTFDLVVGGHSQGLHRMQLDGTVLWSTTAPKLMDALELEGQLVMMDWVGVRDDTIFVLVELTEYSSDMDGNDYETNQQQLVEVDPATGAVRATHPVAPAS